jgi:hypothetical protein
MSATTTPATTVPAAPTRTRSFLTTAPVWRVGALAAVLAAVVTEGYARIIDAAGVSLLVGGFGADHAEPIPAGGFATVTLMWSVVGVILAVVLARRAVRPARTWVRTTVALTLLSFVPSVLTGSTAASTKLALCVAHVLAAAVVIPLLALRLSRASRD